MVGNKNVFLLQLVERWRTRSWERNVSEHDITQHAQIATEKCFFFVYYKLGWDID